MTNVFDNPDKLNYSTHPNAKNLSVYTDDINKIIAHNQKLALTLLNQKSN